MEIKLKIVIVGPSNTGKSNFISRITSNSYDSDNYPTVGIEFHTKKFNVNKKIYSI